MNGGFSMEITAVNSMSNGGNYTQSRAAETTETNQSQMKLQKENVPKDITEENGRNNQEISADEAQQVSIEMNKFMRMLNSNIRFVLHEKTNTRMVQVVDNKDNTVLKEFPSHELLDIKAKIRDYVGILLDKHV